MSKVSEMVNAQEHRYLLQDEVVREPVSAAKKSACCHPQNDMQLQLQSLEAGIHPCCECCGERIEVEVNANDACACLCRRCAARAEGK